MIVFPASRPPGESDLGVLAALLIPDETVDRSLALAGASNNAGNDRHASIPFGSPEEQPRPL